VEWIFVTDDLIPGLADGTGGSCLYRCITSGIVQRMVEDDDGKGCAFSVLGFFPHSSLSLLLSLL
jgi:hypothetical protein